MSPFDDVIMRVHVFLLHLFVSASIPLDTNLRQIDIMYAIRVTQQFVEYVNHTSAIRKNAALGAALDPGPSG